ASAVRRHWVSVLACFLRALLREQARHPPRRERRRKSNEQRRARAFGREHAAIEQGRDDAPRRAFARAQERRDIAARHRTPEQNGLENLTGLRRQRSRTNFFFCPEQDAV